MTANINKQLRGKLYLLPLGFLILTYTIQFKIGGVTHVKASELAFENDISQLAIKTISYTVALFLVAQRKNQFYRFFFGNEIYILFLLTVILSALWSDYPNKVIIYWGHMIGGSLAALSASYYFRDRPYYIYGVLSTILFIPLGAGIFSILIAPQLYTEAETGRWFGLSGNANTLGAIAMVSIWANVVAIKLKKSSSRSKISYILLILSVLVLYKTHSSTSAISASSIVLIGIALQKIFYSRGITKIIYVVAFLWIGMVLIIGFFISKPEIITADGFVNSMGRDLTFTGRTTVWEKGISAILVRPFFGWSYDFNLSVLNYLFKSEGKILAIQFHNGYIDMAVRGGLLGLLVILYMIMRIFINLIKHSKVKELRSNDWIALLLGILIHNLTEASLARDASLLWMLVVFLSFWINMIKIPKSTSYQK